jgi:hypothetical protein
LSEGNKKTKARMIGFVGETGLPLLCVFAALRRAFGNLLETFRNRDVARIREFRELHEI